MKGRPKAFEEERNASTKIIGNYESQLSDLIV